MTWARREAVDGGDGSSSDLWWSADGGCRTTAVRIPAICTPRYGPRNRRRDRAPDDFPSGGGPGRMPRLILEFPRPAGIIAAPRRADDGDTQRREPRQAVSARQEVVEILGPQVGRRWRQLRGRSRRSRRPARAQRGRQDHQLPHGHRPGHANGGNVTFTGPDV